MGHKQQGSVPNCLGGFGGAAVLCVDPGNLKRLKIAPYCKLKIKLMNKNHDVE